MGLAAKQKLKQITRVKLDEKPDPAPSAFAIFRKEIGQSVVDELSAEGQKVDLRKLGKTYADKWAAVPQEKKDEYQRESERLKEEYVVKLEAFKANMKYTEFLETRKKI